MSHLWMQSATWSHTCAVSSVEGTRCFFMAHFRRTSEIGRADMPSEVVWLCFGLGVYAFGNGPHSPSLVSMFRVRAGSDCDVESSRACYRSCNVVNELSPRCQPVNKNPKSKIHNPTSPLLLFANLHTLKRISADNPSRPPPPPFLFLTIIFCVFVYLLLSFLFILNTSLSHS